MADKKKRGLLARLFPGDEEIKRIQQEGLKKIRKTEGTELEATKEAIAKEKKKRLEKRLSERKIKE